MIVVQAVGSKYLLCLVHGSRSRKILRDVTGPLPPFGTNNISTWALRAYAGICTAFITVAAFLQAKATILKQ